MTRLFRSVVSILVLAQASISLTGCIIGDTSADTAGGITTLQVTATLVRPSPCTVNAAAQTTTCEVGLSMVFAHPPLELPISLTLAGLTTPVTLYDPLIV